MSYLCICQQPDNSDLLKGHGLVSPRGLKDWATVAGGLVQVGDKARRKGVQMFEDNMRGHHAWVVLYTHIAQLMTHATSLYIACIHNLTCNYVTKPFSILQRVNVSQNVLISKIWNYKI